MKPTFWGPGDGLCSEPLPPCSDICTPYLASRFDPDADGLTSEEQAVYDPAASAFALEEGVCTALPNLPTAITTADGRLPDENLPHSYNFTCTDNCSPPVCEIKFQTCRARNRRDVFSFRTGKGQLAWYIGSDNCDESKIPQLEGFEGALDIKEGDAETLRTFTFDGDSACFMSSALYSSLGLGSLEMTYVGDARCPCE